MNEKDFSQQSENEKYILETQQEMLKLGKNVEPELWAKKNKFTGSRAGKILLTNLAVLALGVGIYFFKFPNHFVMGGVSGYSVVIAKLIPFSPSQITAACNVVLLVIGLVYFGKRFAFLTTYATIALSLLLGVFEKAFPLAAPLTNEPLLELLFAIALPALGSVILFNMSASSGGSDVIAMIIKDKFNANIGTALILTDLFACCLAAFIFDIKTALFSVLGLFLKGIIVNKMLASLNEAKYFTFITEKGKEIGEYITVNLHRGATKVQGVGIFSGKEKQVLLCVVNKKQGVALRDYAKKIDPTCFVMISDINEVIGRGFYLGF